MDKQIKNSMIQNSSTRTVHKCMRSYLLNSLALLAIVLGNNSAQAQSNNSKPPYDRNLDSIWSKNTFIHTLSPDGQWVAFQEVFTRTSKVTVVNTETGTIVECGEGELFHFSEDSKWFASLSSKRTLTLLNLTRQKQLSFDNINSFIFSHEGTFLAINSSEQELRVIDLKNQETETFINVIGYKWSPSKNELFINQVDNENSKLIMYEVSLKQHKMLAQIYHGNLSNYNWSSNGNSFVFLEGNGENNKLHYNGNDMEHRILNIDRLQNTFPGYQISDRNIWVSSDDKYVFFYRKLITAEPLSTSRPEIWDTSDPWIYPRRKTYESFTLPYLLTLWDVSSNKIQSVGDENTPIVNFNPDHPFAIAYNPLVYEPEYKHYPDTDLTLTDFENGEKRVIAKKVSSEQGNFMFSPSGRFLTYFLDGHWWLYDTLLATNRNVTKDLQSPFHDKAMKLTKEGTPYGIGGWDSKEEHILIYDHYDIWLIGAESQYSNRMTSGSEKKIVYRILKEASSQMTSLQYTTSVSYDLSKGLLLTMNGDNLKSGLTHWQKNIGVVDLVFNDKMIEEGILSDNREFVVYKKSSYNQPPSVHSINLSNREDRMIYQSNPSLLDYDLGKHEFLYYLNEEGKRMKSVLVYPSQYDQKKTYPMITWIYEDNSCQIKYFAPPSEHGPIGFNMLDYSLNGYFILLPDIDFTLGAPGESALASTMVAVKIALKNPSVDGKSLGLMGHSMGGYESAFIVTQTNLFAAAVAGAAVTDLVSSYHNVAWDWETNQMWRSEHQQFRMGTSFYENKQAYVKNSALTHVESLNTPLLLWSGKNDGNINWTQSIYMHMAMKRLQKPGKLLLFENEGHFLINPKNQASLSLILKEWFDTHLKK